MDSLRSAFNQLIKKEQYNRFPLQSTDDGHAEIKLSDDCAEAGDEEGRPPSFRPSLLRQKWFQLGLIVVGALLIFGLGIMIGYSSKSKPQVSVDVEPEPEAEATPEAVELGWNDITQLLKEKLAIQSMTKTLNIFDLPGRAAGSQQDEHLANLILDEFKKQRIDSWAEANYVQLQEPDRGRPNRVSFGSSVFSPVGYLAYSPPGRVEGKLVYGNYGRREDLEVLQKSNIVLEGSVLLLRAGNISFAEQVNNAAAKGAAAVLIYPDPEQHDFRQDTSLYGHVHLGSGDPYTPGFPSFNHTQFPPTQSSGLPKIPAQTITANNASILLQNISGSEPAADSGFKGALDLVYRLGGQKNITVEVNNVLVNKEIHNVFGIIKGITDPDRYVVLGAQRDTWDQGYTKATVGTSVLMELAKAIRQMEEDGFKPRRSIIFASWSAGEYGSVGATEWLEAYMTSIDKKILAYINLDGVVKGRGRFMASASPLLYSLLESTMTKVQDPFSSETLYKKYIGGNKLETTVMKAMTVDDPAYPFMAFAGIPSISFHFISSQANTYMYYGTNLDNKDHLNYLTVQKTSEAAVAAAQLAGQMALRLVHDHVVKLDTSRYSSVLNNAVRLLYNRINLLTKSGQLKDVSPKWLSKASASFNRAARSINSDITNTDVTDPAALRVLNDRLMSVESILLSPYVSPTETPFRHLLFGRGNHTLASIAESTDMNDLRVKLAEATWTLQGCANAMVGNIWEISYTI